jgi:hypothetical protein
MASAWCPGSVLMLAAGIPAASTQTGPGAGMARRAAGQMSITGRPAWCDSSCRTVIPLAPPAELRPVAGNPLVIVQQATRSRQRQGQPGDALGGRVHHHDSVYTSLRPPHPVAVAAPRVDDLLAIPIDRAGRLYLTPRRSWPERRRPPGVRLIDVPPDQPEWHIDFSVIAATSPSRASWRVGGRRDRTHNPCSDRPPRAGRADWPDRTFRPPRRASAARSHRRSHLGRGRLGLPRHLGHRRPGLGDEHGERRCWRLSSGQDGKKRRLAPAGRAGCPWPAPPMPRNPAHSVQQTKPRQNRALCIRLVRGPTGTRPRPDSAIRCPAEKSEALRPVATVTGLRSVPAAAWAPRSPGDRRTPRPGACHSSRTGRRR